VLLQQPITWSSLFLIIIVLRQILNVISLVLFFILKCVGLWIVLEDIVLEEWEKVIQWHAWDGGDEGVDVVQFEVIQSDAQAFFGFKCCFLLIFVDLNCVV